MFVMTKTKQCRVCLGHYPPVRFERYRLECKSCVSKRKVAERKRHPHKYAYTAQKDKAKERGIAWEFEFKQWVEWWGEDFGKRGVSNGLLAMCRYADSGPYNPSNCFKASHADNTRMAVAKRCGRLF